MFRIAIVSGIALFSFVAANAGQIQIGGANGLTSSTVTGAGCSTGGPCSEQGYVPVMFQGISVSPNNFTDAAGDGGSGVTFSPINDTGNFWGLPTGSATSTLTVPIGVFGVTDVWTMINDIESNEMAGARDISVTFNFGTNADGIGGTDAADTVRLFNSNATNANGQVRDALVCSSACNQTSQVALAGEVNGGVTVVAENVWQQSFFNCIAGSTGQTSDQCGTANLDDQGFFFNSLNLGGGLTNLNTYLVSVQVKEIGATGGGAGLSAITIDAASATPEPSTVLLFFAGLGALGFGRLRKKA